MSNWYENLVADKPTSFTASITPDIADWLLQTSPGNRRLRKTHVNYLAKAIERGEWRVTSQGIGFDVKGGLRDGHHRLNAIIQSGRTVEALVVLGMPVDAFEVIDIGVKRKTEDLLGVSQMSGQVLRFAAYIAYGQNTPSPDQIKKMLGSKLSYHIILLEEAAAGTLRKTITSNAVRLAAVLCMIENGSTNHVIEQYMALLRKNYDRMTVEAKAFERMITANRGISTTESCAELMTRARLVFSNEFISNPRVRVTEALISSTFPWAKRIILDSVKAS